MTDLPRRPVLARLASWPLLAAAPAAVAPGAHAQGTPSAAASGAQPAAGQRRPLPVQGKPALYQRIITRPGGSLTPRPDPAGGRALPGFSVFYVYSREGGPQGWVEVGAGSNGQTEGWIPAPKAIAWSQGLVLAFNNPSGRELAMFFRDAETPRRLWLDSRGRAAESARLRQAANAGQEGPVIALEPATYVDITRQFYLLPILGFEKIQTESMEEARILEVISAPVAPPARQLADPNLMKNYKGAVVFVVDTTMSMGPYIERVREALKRVVGRIGNTAVRDNFRFGVVAFRDHMGGDARLEYVTRMVSVPSFNEAPDAILSRLSAAQETQFNNQDFDEDAMAGVKLALDDVPWKEFAGRYIILVTDAGTRDASDKLSQTHLGPKEINDIARSEPYQVATYAIHLRTPEGRANHARAESQYRTLTQFGPAGSLYYPVPEGNVDQFSRQVDLLTDALLADVAKAVGRPIGGATPPQNEAERRLREQAEVVGTAMRLSYLGRMQQQTAPDVVRSFVVDQDLVEATALRKPLDVRVLLTRNQLSDLAETVRVLIRAYNEQRLRPETFFAQIRAAAAASTLDPRRMAEFQRLAGTFGDYLSDLPYESEVSEITLDDWINKGAGARAAIRNSLETKLVLYEEYNRQGAYWVSPDGNRASGELLYPVPLAHLP